MRFDLLFEDLEGQLETQLDAEGVHRRGEEERLRAARAGLRDRLAALLAAGAGSIRLRLRDGYGIELMSTTLGRNWLTGESGEGDGYVVPLDAIATVSLRGVHRRLSLHPADEGTSGGAPAATIGIGVLLRDLARRRVGVDVTIASEPAALHGTIDRVGADHFDLAVHERDVPRRDSAVAETRLVPLPMLILLRV